MERADRKEDLWSDYLATIPAEQRPKNPKVDAWSFGSSSDMADRLLERVLSGEKIATSGLVWSYAAEGEVIPAPGDFSVLLDGDGNPRAVIETLEVHVQPFRLVGENIAYDEGEGDRSLSFWRAVHWHFFMRECVEIGKVPDWDMEIVSEYFRLVYVKSS